MFKEKYHEKAQFIFDESRRSGARADGVAFLEAEAINLALMETLAAYGDDETQFDSIYASSLPRSRQLLVDEFIKAANYIGTNGAVDYRGVVARLKENEIQGGRGAFEPRTVMGESKLIATVLGIVKDGGKLDKDSANLFIQENLEQIFENLIAELK